MTATRRSPRRWTTWDEPNTRKALGVGLTPEEIRHVAVLAITTRGFPAAVAGLGWMDEVLEREA